MRREGRLAVIAGSGRCHHGNCAHVLLCACIWVQRARCCPRVSVPEACISRGRVLGRWGREGMYIDVKVAPDLLQHGQGKGGQVIVFLCVNGRRGE